MPRRNAPALFRRTVSHHNKTGPPLVTKEEPLAKLEKRRIRAERPKGVNDIRTCTRRVEHHPFKLRDGKLRVRACASKQSYIPVFQKSGYAPVSQRDPKLNPRHWTKQRENPWRVRAWGKQAPGVLRTSSLLGAAPAPPGIPAASLRLTRTFAVRRTAK